jgi:predicted MPP superfamily phosphohydrolase
MRRFFIYLHAVTAIAQLPLVATIAFAVNAWWGWVLGGAIGAGVAVLFHGRVKLAQWDRPISVLQRHALEEPYFVIWCASLLSWVLALVAVPLVWALGGSPLGAVAGCFAFALLIAAWGVMVRRRWVRLRHIQIDLVGLPRAFDGYRVLQLSDLHVGSHCPRTRVDAWVQRVNALDVDLVALTGDYVTSGVRFHEDIASALGALRAKDGVFAVMGNHDYYGDGEPLMTLLSEQGIRLLRNESTRITRGRDELVVAGVDDIYTKRIDIDRALRDVPSAATVLMLAHDPSSFPELAQRGCSLVLSGHTHWGQIALPFFGPRLNYARLMTRYAADRHQLHGAELYVHPGLGTTGPPVRLGTSPELTVLTLRAC